MTRFVSCLNDDVPNPKIIAERPIYHGHAYRGLLIHYAFGWVHSLHPFGAGAFASPDLAEADFWATKERLPPSMHKAIFGHERQM
jgi:hypothetical protein